MYLSSLNVISYILKKFKIEDVVLVGDFDKNFFKEMFDESIKDQVSFIAINSNVINFVDESCHLYNFASDSNLISLKNFQEYGAIFINDVPNWYTVYNELQIIDENNSNFPLVFVCNNKFPNKRRDSYLNLEDVPELYLHEFSNELEIYDDFNSNSVKLNLDDGLYYSVHESNVNNGVLTAIEDFCNENGTISADNSFSFAGITLLYASSINNSKTMNQIHKNLSDFNFNDNLYDSFFKNQILVSYLDKHEFNQLENYKNEIYSHEIKSREYSAKINNLNSIISFKDAQIKSLTNKFSILSSEHDYKLMELDDYKHELNSCKNNLTYYEEEIKNKNDYIHSISHKLENANNEIINLLDILKETENKLDDFKEHNVQLSKNNDYLNYLKGKYITQLSKLHTFKSLSASLRVELIKRDNIVEDLNSKLSANEEVIGDLNSKLKVNDYVITTFKKELTEKDLTINYIKHNVSIKKILSPFSYLILIVNSNLKCIGLNVRLYRFLKSTDYFDEGYYLRNYPDLIDSKWYDFFSLELHFVCRGFDEKRSFNKNFKKLSKNKILEIK